MVTSHIPENWELQKHRQQNLKSRTHLFIYLFAFCNAHTTRKNSGIKPMCFISDNNVGIKEINKLIGKEMSRSTYHRSLQNNNNSMSHPNVS